MDSIASAESETEDERQRILAGILAEEDDDSVVDDVINKESGASGGVANFDSTKNPSSQQQQQNLPNKILSRKRIESENAFSSSSDDDYDGTDLEGIYGMATMPVSEGRRKADDDDDAVNFSCTHSAGSGSSGANNNIVTQED
eukprot:scaffold143120_cov98-Cyclotella_meneghiniana.AAC.1